MDQQSKTPLRVLFLCTGNSARSQIAEALLLRKGGDRFRVASAGTNPAAQVNEHAVEALAAIGIDWSDRKPKGFESVSHEEWDMIITLCDRSREACASIPGNPIYAHWGTPDPTESRDLRRAFGETLQLLSWRIDLMLTVPFDALQRAALAKKLESIGGPQRRDDVSGPKDKPQRPTDPTPFVR